MPTKRIKEGREPKPHREPERSPSKRKRGEGEPETESAEIPEAGEESIIERRSDGRYADE
jgi:hypothetical protein